MTSYGHPDTLAVLQQPKDLFAPSSPPERGNDEIARLDQILGFAPKAGADPRAGWKPKRGRPGDGVVDHQCQEL